MSNAGGVKSLNRYSDMLAGNTVWSPWTPAGAYDALATVTVPSGGAASVTFAGIPQGYKHLQVRAIQRSSRAAANDYGNIYLNSDTTGANYTQHRLRGDGSTASAAAGTSDFSYGDYPAGSTTASVFGGFIFDLLDYTSTNKNKTQRLLFGYDANGSGQINLTSKLWLSTAAVTSITFDNRGVNWASETTFALYGVK